MLRLEEIESGETVTHKNTGLRYVIVEIGDGEVLLSPDSSDMQDLEVPADLFCQEFVSGDRYNTGRPRSRGRGRTSASSPTANATEAAIDAPRLCLVTAVTPIATPHVASHATHCVAKNRRPADTAIRLVSIASCE